MLRRVTILTAILSLVVCAAGFAAESWVTVAPPNTGFSVLMPATPELHTQSKDFSSGTVVVSTWIAKTPRGIYLASTTEYPEDIDQKREFLLDRINFLSEVKAKLVSETDIILKGNPGKEFTGKSDQYTFKSRIYLVGTRRLYMIAAGEPTATFDVARADKLLLSFDLTQK